MCFYTSVLFIDLFFSLIRILYLFIQRYKCTNWMNVYDIASKHQFGNPSDKTNEIKYLSVVYGLAEYISKLHDLNYIHRDIQCKFLYYSLEKNKVGNSSNHATTKLICKSRFVVSVNLQFSVAKTIDVIRNHEKRNK